MKLEFKLRDSSEFSPCENLRTLMKIKYLQMGGLRPLYVKCKRYFYYSILSGPQRNELLFGTLFF